MRYSRPTHVEFAFGDYNLAGEVIDYVPDGDVSGPNGLLVVDVDGLEYRVNESDVERLDR